MRHREILVDFAFSILLRVVDDNVLGCQVVREQWRDDGLGLSRTGRFCFTRWRGREGRQSNVETLQAVGGGNSPSRIGLAEVSSLLQGDGEFLKAPFYTRVFALKVLESRERGLIVFGGVDQLSALSSRQAGFKVGVLWLVADRHKELCDLMLPGCGERPARCGQTVSARRSDEAASG